MMTVTRKSTVVGVLSALATFASLSVVSLANAGPVKLVPTTRYGAHVDKTTGQNVCLLGGSDECQFGAHSEAPGGFGAPEGVAAAPTGNIYVADQNNHRVQELTAAGEFVLMFGKEVNATTHGDICTAEEVKNDAVKCESGASGTGFEAITVPRSIAVDPITEDIYVQDWQNWRVDEYTANGQFLLTIGKEVNTTKDGTVGASEEEKNVCRSGEACQAGVKSALGSTERGAFDFEQRAGDLLSVSDTSEHLLYVGDGHRIQEFASTGEWKGEVSLPLSIIASSPTSSITALAVTSDGQTAYVGYNHENAVRRLDLMTGEESGATIGIAPRQTGNSVLVNGLAVDPSGQLAVASLEIGTGIAALHEPFGLLINGDTGETISEFGVPGSELNSYTPITFDGKSNLYVVVDTKDELLSYIPLPIAEVSTGKAGCKEGPEEESSITFDCTLSGAINPYNVPGTEIFFEWGRASEAKTCLGPEFDTALQQVTTQEALLTVEAQIHGLRPDQAFCFDEVGLDENARPPENIVGKSNSFETLRVPPKLVGHPDVSFVTFDSAVLHGELNPENAPTEFFFEYELVLNSGEKPLAKCPGLKLGACHGVESTAPLNSALYGRMGTTAEAVGLEPGATYAYRLAASNNAEESAIGAESSFTTAGAPSVEAVTLPASAVTSTGALASGSVAPEGQQATYTIELGLYEGASTHYSPVASGSTGTSTGTETESASLTNLQPSTTYAYRIAINDGYGEARGAPAIFTTAAASMPVTLTAPTLLAVPRYEFPRPRVICKRGYKLNKAGVCVKAKAKNGKVAKKRKGGKRAKVKTKRK